jgi:hypothetical protein
MEQFELSSVQAPNRIRRRHDVLQRTVDPVARYDEAGIIEVSAFLLAHG